MSLLDCYDARLDGLADLAGDLDPTSAESLLEWQVSQWRSFADRLGFRAELQPAIEAAVKTKGQFGSLTAVAVSLVAQWIDQRPAQNTPPGYPAEQIADLIADTVAAWRSETLSLWRVEKPVTSIVGNGCAAGFRAFPTANSATYFRPALSADSTPRHSCAYTTPVVVYLGTWPWYHGGSLNEDAPGLRWRAAAGAKPGEQGVRALIAAWAPAGNAATDARDVLDHYRYYQQKIDSLLAPLPSSQGQPGALYTTPTGLIRASMETVKGRYLRGPLGPVSVVAHNHIIRCFAAFWAMRRALMKHAEELDGDIIARLKSTGDPCAADLAGKYNEPKEKSANLEITK